jgi:hypothetical protein
MDKFYVISHAKGARFIDLHASIMDCFDTEQKASEYAFLAWKFHTPAKGRADALYVPVFIVCQLNDEDLLCDWARVRDVRAKKVPTALDTVNLPEDYKNLTMEEYREWSELSDYVSRAGFPEWLEEMEQGWDGEQ